MSFNFDFGRKKKEKPILTFFEKGNTTAVHQNVLKYVVVEINRIYF